MTLTSKHMAVALLLLSSLFLSQCGAVTRLRYTIPDNYEGFLVIQYACPSGVPITRQDGQVQIIFDDNGTACIAPSYVDVYPSGVSTIDQVHTKRGIAVPHVAAVTNAPVYALVDIAVLENRDGPSESTPTTTFSILWVGRIERLYAMQQSGTYSTQIAQFLEAHFGVLYIP